MINAFYGSWPETPLLSVIAYINCHFYGLIMNHGVMVTVVRCRWSVHITLCHVVALVWSYQWGYRGWWHPSETPGVNIQWGKPKRDSEGWLSLLPVYTAFFSNELRIHLTWSDLDSFCFLRTRCWGDHWQHADSHVRRRPIWAEILMTRMTSIWKVGLQNTWPHLTPANTHQ